tara:strand:- start:3714 stop:4175 length:462 start_codon:yes stop_codon:yes gene_type:complete
METLETNAHQMPTQKDFSFTFKSSKSPEEIFNLLLHVRQWWTGFYEETITGKSEKPGDEFEFLAGGGAHFSKHKLVTLEPYKTIVWQIIDSKLSFITKMDEWIGTRIQFDIKKNDNNTQVTFTHKGLTPQFECYNNCESAWTQYMKQLEAKLK